MPPIINSDSLGKITSETKNILIEASGTSQKLLNKAITMAVCDLIDYGGEAYSVEVCYKNKKEAVDLKSEKMKINLENANKLLGLNLAEKDAKKLLEKMGYDYQNKEAEIPAYRADIMHEVDIIEDMAIAYGYENFQPEIPEIATIGEENKKEIIKRKISEILTGLNMLEISTLHLLTKDDAKKLNIKGIEVEESKTDYRILRPNLFSSSLKILSENIDSEYPQRIFEIGKIFSKDENKETGISEKTNLIIALTPGNFTELRQVLEYLGRMLNLEFKIADEKKEGFIEGRIGKIIFDDKEIGIIGEVHPSMLKLWHIKMPLVVLEINLDEIFEKLT